MTLALAERGYRNIGYVGVEQGELRGVQRLAGYRAAVGALGYAPHLTRAVPHDASYRGGGEGLAQLIEAHPEVDAVLFGNDVFAIHALMMCRRRGWDVPGRVAIVGFGGLDLTADLSPALSTVRVPGHAIGERAARMVLARLAGEQVSERKVDLGFELVFRESA
jgi:LacI family gluconate utilization system Gnt-I transcriptional repressor